MKNNRISIDALFAYDGISPNEHADLDPRELIGSADVVVAVDVMSQRKQLLYGRQKLKDIVASGKPQMGVYLEIELDEKTDDLEKLCACSK